MSRPEEKTLKSTPSDVLPLCVDLDGTLLRIDTLHESTFAAAFDDWRVLFRLPGWLAEGKAKLKAELASRWGFDPRRFLITPSFWNISAPSAKPDVIWRCAPPRTVPSPSGSPNTWACLTR